MTTMMICAHMNLIQVHEVEVGLKHLWITQVQTDPVEMNEKIDQRQGQTTQHVSSRCFKNTPMKSALYENDVFQAHKLCHRESRPVWNVPATDGIKRSWSASETKVSIWLVQLTNALRR